MSVCCRRAALALLLMAVSPTGTASQQPGDLAWGSRAEDEPPSFAPRRMMSAGHACH